VARAVPG